EFRSGGNFAGRVNVVAASDSSAAKGGARQTLRRSDSGSANSAVSLSGGAIEGPKASGDQGTGAVSGDQGTGAVSGDSGTTGGGSGANGGLSADETSGAPSDEESAADTTGDADTDDGADGETDAAAGPFASIPGTIGKIALICLISLAALISILRTIRAIRTNKRRQHRYAAGRRLDYPPIHSAPRYSGGENRGNGFGVRQGHGRQMSGRLNRRS
ncbi:MAG: hypothetical protein LBU58_07110, partial [Clostridiales bacterium]|nr:hypothetical protein [Clostridiales bacterium]